MRLRFVLGLVIMFMASVQSGLGLRPESEILPGHQPAQLGAQHAGL